MTNKTPATRQNIIDLIAKADTALREAICLANRLDDEDVPAELHWVTEQLDTIVRRRLITD